MHRKRISAVLGSLVCLFTLSSPGFAQGPNFITMLRQIGTGSSRVQVARQSHLAAIKGTEAIADSEDKTGWESKHKLYVGCTNTPPSKTFATISDAFAVVVPYTTIKVCAGQYAGNNELNTPDVAVIGQGGQGAVTIACGSTPNPLDGSGGIFLNASHESVANVSVIDCEGGVVINYAGFSGPSAVSDDDVSDSFFTGNLIGAIALYCDKCKIESNEFDTNTASIGVGADVKGKIVGNEIVGDGISEDQNYVGILLVYSTDTEVKSNRESGNAVGLGLLLSEYVDAENNTLNGNYLGVGLAFYNSGNTFKKNSADGNIEGGFYADDTSGADAGVGTLPNRYLHNKAFGNGSYDYEDDTAGYSGSTPGTNAGTADYYSDNKGVNALPPAILAQ